MIVTARFHLPKSVQAELRERPVQWGFGLLSEAAYRRSYSREGEDWADTVIRVVDGVMSIRKEHLTRVVGVPWDESRWNHEAEALADAIFSMRLLPPGRGLWAMGTEFIYERGSLALNNCAFVSVRESLSRAAAWLMDALMCGVGVGFDTQHGSYSINPTQGEPVFFDVPDSREGWVESVRRLIASYEQGSRPMRFGYGLIRKAGTPIRGFGGVAGGFKSLKELHERLRVVFELALERRESSGWRSRVTADVQNSIGCCVVAGNVRRSAEIALGAIQEEEFLHLKDYDRYPERREIGWMSNNSVALEYPEEFELLPSIAPQIAYNGEPGLLNLVNVQKYGRTGERMPDQATGINPCVTGDTMIAVADGRGAVRIDELAASDTDVPVYAWGDPGHGGGVRMGRRPRLTGCDVPVVRVTLSNGVSFRTTPDHKFLVYSGQQERADQLRPGQTLKAFRRYNKGTYWHVGCSCQSCTEHRRIAAFLGEKDKVVHHVDHDGLNNSWSNLQFLSERAHTDHHMVGASNPRHRFTAEQEDRLKASRRPGYATPYAVSYTSSVFERVSKICEGCGDRFEVSVRKREVAYCSRACWKSSTPQPPRAGRKSERVKVVSVEDAGTADVYNLTTDDLHNYAIVAEVDGEMRGAYTANCGEIPLESYELCNLVELFPTRCTTPAELSETARLATLYSSTVSLLRSHSPETNQVVARNRRIGVSVTGIADWIDATSVSSVFGKLNRLYEDVVRPTNAQLAAEAGVPASIRVTTVKPSGTVSLLAGVSSGVHWPTAGHVLRRMRVASGSSVAERLEKAGVPHEADTYSTDTDVFEFPVRYGKGRTRSVKHVSVYEQAAVVAMLQKAWADNAVSNTLTFQPHEASQVERVLALFAPLVKSLSLLPDREGVYEQMPLEQITREEFERRSGEIGVADWKGTLEDAVPDRYCENDVCEVPL